MAIFTLLRLFPQLDIIVWGEYWISQLIHYYIISFASFMALITAVFINIVQGQDTTVRILFMTQAFASIAALLLVRGLATPGILMDEGLNEAFNWSMRLSLLVGAIFFAVAVFPWAAGTNETILKNRRLLISSCTALYLIYLAIAFVYPAPLRFLSNNSDVAHLILGWPSVVLYLWAAYRFYQSYQEGRQSINRQISIALLLLAQAQLADLFSIWGRVTWLLIHILIISALVVALYALLIYIQSRRQLRASHYFGALGSIVILGVALFVGEFGARLLQISTRRVIVVAITLAQGSVSFAILYFIVRYLDKLILERNQALNREQELRADLSRLIVHDLKNPLTVITSGLNLLSHGRFNSSSETQTRLIQQLEAASGKVLGLIDDLLNVEKMETGELELIWQPVNTAVLLRERVEEYQILAATYKQTLRLEMPSQMPVLRADAKLLSRVIDNLLINALKYTPEEGDILVSTTVQPASLTIYFDDTGPGIPIEERERIFEKFSQVRGIERRGAGLGLTFCKMVINAHQGEVIVKDSPLGGARFEVKLPLNITSDAGQSTAVSQNGFSNKPARA